MPYACSIHVTVILLQYVKTMQAICIKQFQLTGTNLNYNLSAAFANLKSKSKSTKIQGSFKWHQLGQFLSLRCSPLRCSPFI